MRLSQIFIIAGLCTFAVSCAHKKKVAVDESKTMKVVVAKTAAPDSSITCIVGKDKRRIVLDKEPKRCEVHYTKFGEKAQMAWAEATPTICTDVLNKIRTNIESRGYKCVSDNQESTTRGTASQ